RAASPRRASPTATPTPSRTSAWPSRPGPRPGRPVSGVPVSGASVSGVHGRTLGAFADEPLPALAARLPGLLLTVDGDLPSAAVGGDDLEGGLVVLEDVPCVELTVGEHLPLRVGNPDDDRRGLTGHADDQGNGRRRRGGAAGAGRLSATAAASAGRRPRRDRAPLFGLAGYRVDQRHDADDEQGQGGHHGHGRDQNARETPRVRPMTSHMGRLAITVTAERRT